MKSPTRTWRIYAPGYHIRNRVAIYGSGHISVGKEVWDLFLQYRDKYPEDGVWLEFGLRLSYEDRLGKSTGPLVSVSSAYCTGLGAKIL